jgi:hypothetical protein
MLFEKYIFDFFSSFMNLDYFKETKIKEEKKQKSNLHNHFNFFFCKIHKQITIKFFFFLLLSVQNIFCL